MAAAGIDVVLPVYWGFHKSEDEWSWKGLAPMAQAWQSLHAEGARPPRIGMFFDTTVVDMRDLRTTSGKEFFYANIKDFFSRIPREQWALVNSRPVIFLFTSDYTGAVDQSTFDHAYSRFQADFGVRPYIVRELSWDYPILRWEGGQRVRDYTAAIQTDNSYVWGAAIHGYRDGGGVASVGPGYDDRKLPSGATFVDRQDGNFYAWNFWLAIQSGKPLLFIETWNEVHEASGIGETIEYGRFYIDGTRVGASMFHGTPDPIVTPTASNTPLPPSTSTATATPTATASPTATSTAAATPTATASSTATAAAAATATAFPSATPTAEKSRPSRPKQREVFAQ